MPVRFHTRNSSQKNTPYGAIFWRNKLIFAENLTIYCQIWHKMSDFRPKKQDFGAKLSTNSRQKWARIGSFWPKIQDFGLKLEKKCPISSKKDVFFPKIWPIGHIFMDLHTSKIYDFWQKLGQFGTKLPENSIKSSKIWPFMVIFDGFYAKWGPKRSIFKAYASTKISGIRRKIGHLELISRDLWLNLPENEPFMAHLG